jgi:hypothetical protein
MGLGAKNDQKGLDALTSVRAREPFEAVLPHNPTAGAGMACHIFPPAPPKPDGLVRISRKNLFNALHRVKYPSVNEFTA